MGCRIEDGEGLLKPLLTHWSPERWQEYQPLLTYCRDNQIRLIACGLPLEVRHLHPMNFNETLYFYFTHCFIVRPSFSEIHTN